MMRKQTLSEEMGWVSKKTIDTLLDSPQVRSAINVQSQEDTYTELFDATTHGLPVPGVYEVTVQCSPTRADVRIREVSYSPVELYHATIERNESVTE